MVPHLPLSQRGRMNASLVLLLLLTLLISSHPKVLARNAKLLDIKSRASRSQLAADLTWSGGEYVVRVGIGTPSTNLYMTLDTASQIPWLQCAPCVLCSIQLGAVFDPSESSSYATLSCASSLCQQLESHNCQAGQCQFLSASSDTSVTYGDLCSESFRFGSTVAVGNVSFGCSHAHTGASSSQHVSAGAFAAGKGPLSFPSQLGNRVFSYCLPDPSTNRSGALLLGDAAFPTDGGITPLLEFATNPTMFYVNLTGISVADQMLSIPVSDYGSKGFLTIDSRTPVTTLPIDIYSVLRNEFITFTSDIPLAITDNDLFDTCYNMSGVDFAAIPTIVLHFDGGANLSLPSNNILVEDTTQQFVFCLAFSTPSYGADPILGTIQQQGFHIGFDMHRSLLAVSPHLSC